MRCGAEGGASDCGCRARPSLTGLRSAVAYENSGGEGGSQVQSTKAGDTWRDRLKRSCSPERLVVEGCRPDAWSRCRCILPA
jgi:hypothetical protein